VTSPTRGFRHLQHRLDDRPRGGVVDAASA
jgi:hypothetical protein